MPIVLNTTPADHIPEDFTVESLTEGGLTEQEIKALSEGDDPIVTIPEAEAKDDADPLAGDIGTAPPEADPAAQAASQPEAAATEEPPRPEIPDLSEAEATITRINGELESLADQYDAGELTKAEFIAKQNELIATQTAAQVQIQTVQQQLQQAHQQQLAYWYQRLEVYKKVAPELWSEEHINGFNDQLHAVTDPRSAYANLPRDTQIRLAHQFYAAAYEASNGKPLSGGAALPKSDAAPKADKLDVRRDPRPEPPTTLSGFNSDTSAEVEDSAFAVIDRTIGKDPMEAERMFSRMTPEQQERYLNEV